MPVLKDDGWPFFNGLPLRPIQVEDIQPNLLHCSITYHKFHLIQPEYLTHLTGMFKQWWKAPFSRIINISTIPYDSNFRCNLRCRRCRYFQNCYRLQHFKQSVVLTGRNTTGPPCSVGRPITHPRSRRQRADRPSAQLAWPPAALQTTTTDASHQNNTGPLGGPVIIYSKGLTAMNSIADIIFHT